MKKLGGNGRSNLEAIETRKRGGIDTKPSIDLEHSMKKEKKKTLQEGEYKAVIDLSGGRIMRREQQEVTVVECAPTAVQVTDAGTADR